MSRFCIMQRKVRLPNSASYVSSRISSPCNHRRIAHLIKPRPQRINHVTDACPITGLTLSYAQQRDTISTVHMLSLRCVNGVSALDFSRRMTRRPQCEPLWPLWLNSPPPVPPQKSLKSYPVLHHSAYFEPCQAGALRWCRDGDEISFLANCGVYASRRRTLLR
jgi:hypothetical protein